MPIIPLLYAIKKYKMTETEFKILQTGISILIFFIARIAIIKIIDRTVTKSLLQKTRGKIIKKVFQIILIVILSTFIMLTWGVNRSELFLFMTSVLTVIGIALFAQWSHLSNMTSGVIIFFNHSVKLDDTISIIDKDYDIEGRISDIGLFFVKLKTKHGEEVTLPNNIFLHKMIKKKII
jgi:small-conductance mechanosensitive channel